MFIEYVAGMLLDKAGKDCYDPQHTKPCAGTLELHHTMLRQYVNELEKPR